MRGLWIKRRSRRYSRRWGFNDHGNPSQSSLSITYGKPSSCLSRCFCWRHSLFFKSMRPGYHSSGDWICRRLFRGRPSQGPALFPDLYPRPFAHVYGTRGHRFRYRRPFWRRSAGHGTLLLAVLLLLSASYWWVFFSGAFPIPVHLQPKQKGILGAFLLGIFFGIVSSPCATPVLALILTFVASKGEVAYGTSLLFVFYALGHCALIFLAGTATGFAESFIKSKGISNLTIWGKRIRGIDCCIRWNFIYSIWGITLF